MSPASPLVTTNHPVGRYQKGLKQSKGEKAMKTAKTVKTTTGELERQRLIIKASFLLVFRLFLIFLNS